MKWFINRALLLYIKEHSSDKQQSRVCLQGNDKFLQQPPNAKSDSPWTFNIILHSGAECVLAAGMNPPFWLRCLPCFQPLFTANLATGSPNKNVTVSEAKRMVNSHAAMRAPVPCEDFQNRIFKQKHTNLFSLLSAEKTRGKALMEMFHFFSSQQMLNEQHRSLDLHL